jgi:hypothetical protein
VSNKNFICAVHCHIHLMRFIRLCLWHTWGMMVIKYHLIRYGLLMGVIDWLITIGFGTSRSRCT